MKQILCIGQAVYDITYPVDNFPIENQKYRIYEHLECMGAPAANAAYLCALWDCDTYLIARVGHDLYGKQILKELNEANVQTSSMLIDAKNTTSLSCIIANSTNGSRTILNSPMVYQELPVHLPDLSFAVLLLDGHEIEISIRALQHYPAAISILDAGTYKEEILPLIHAVDYLVCSQDFAQQYTKQHLNIDDREQVYQIFSRLEQINSHTIVITLGDQGVVYKEGGELYHIPAFPANTVDTTGAGDIFHGAFAYGMAMGYSLHQTIQLAALTSSISVETLGGKTSIPKLNTVLSLADSYSSDELREVLNT